MPKPPTLRVIVDTEPSLEDIRFLEQQLYEFNVKATGIFDGEFLGVFLRADDDSPAGGAYGWIWGGCCYIRYLAIAAHLRKQGHGTKLMRAVESRARAQGCTQIVLETHDFQAPDFYRRLGFEVTGRVEGYPRGHQYLTLVKRLGEGPESKALGPGPP